MAVRAGGRNILTFNILPHIRELFDIIGCINTHRPPNTAKTKPNRTEPKSNKLK